jgi:hypothetical protein
MLDQASERTFPARASIGYVSRQFLLNFGTNCPVTRGVSPSRQRQSIQRHDACLAEHLHGFTAVKALCSNGPCTQPCHWSCAHGRTASTLATPVPKGMRMIRTTPASDPAGFAASAVWCWQQRLRPDPASVSAAPAAGFFGKMGACCSRSHPFHACQSHHV